MNGDDERDPYQYCGLEWLPKCEGTRYEWAVTNVLDAAAIFKRLLNEPDVEKWRDQIEEFLETVETDYARKRN